MKKQMKKLVLNRETVVNLEKDLGQVTGGVTMNPAVCDTSGVYYLPDLREDLHGDLSLLTPRVGWEWGGRLKGQQGRQGH